MWVSTWSMKLLLRFKPSALLLFSFLNLITCWREQVCFLVISSLVHVRLWGSEVLLSLYFHTLMMRRDRNVFCLFSESHDPVMIRCPRFPRRAAASSRAQTRKHRKRFWRNKMKYNRNCQKAVCDHPFMTLKLLFWKASLVKSVSLSFLRHGGCVCVAGVCVHAECVCWRSQFIGQKWPHPPGPSTLSNSPGFQRQRSLR